MGERPCGIGRGRRRQWPVNDKDQIESSPQQHFPNFPLASRFQDAESAGHRARVILLDGETGTWLKWLTLLVCRADRPAMAQTSAHQPQPLSHRICSLAALGR
jgi:hypothetical protein